MFTKFIIIFALIVFVVGCHATMPGRANTPPAIYNPGIRENPPVLLQDVPEIEVRGVRFGATEVSVRSNEKAEYVESKKIGSKSIVMYNDFLFGSPVRVGYKFLKDELYSLVYVFTNPGSCGSAVSIYTKAKAELADKYGPPATKDLDTRNQCFRLSEWKFTSNGRPTTIGLALEGDNYKSNINLHYEDDYRVNIIPSAQSDDDRGKL